jgi:hypothetical protein
LKVCVLIIPELAVHALQCNTWALVYSSSTRVNSIKLPLQSPNLSFGTTLQFWDGTLSVHTKIFAKNAKQLFEHESTQFLIVSPNNRN